MHGMNIKFHNISLQIINFDPFSRNQLNIGCNLAEDEVEGGGGREGDASATAGTVFIRPHLVYDR